MATKTKHKERSCRSYHDSKPFASFEHKANWRKGQKVQRESFGEKIKALLHRTTNK